MSKAGGFIIFITGAAIGSAVTWKYLKTKYEQIAQEEIDSVKEVFAKRETVEKENREKADKAKDKPDIMEYADKIKNEGYTNYSDVNSDKNDAQKDVEKPYVITPEEFGEFDDYNQISLIFYADKVLADENNEIVDEVERIIGFESLNHFGEYEDDSVFVRNDRLKCDYEILLDQRNYNDIIPSSNKVNNE